MIDMQWGERMGWLNNAWFFETIEWMSDPFEVISKWGKLIPIMRLFNYASLYTHTHTHDSIQLSFHLISEYIATINQSIDHATN